MQVHNDPSASTTAPKKKIPPCRRGCPAGIDIPRYVRHIGQGDFDGALAVIREKIPFAAVCGYACVHPCEAVCARRQFDEAVAIRMLKRAADEKSRGKRQTILRKPATGKKVAVIGSGPCGLTAAFYLSCLGHDVAVFESQPQAGGMLRYGIPAYRLPNAVVDREIDVIRSCGVDIHTNASVSSAEKLLAEGYSAVLVAAGAWQPFKIGVEGEDSPMVMDGLHFLAQVNTGRKPPIGSRVIVVGGGNTAVDAARASLRMGATTTLIYRRNREDMPASSEEVADAEEEGVEIEFMTMPLKVASKQVVCMQMEPGAVDESGRKKPVPVPGSEFSLPCDTLILGIGQTADAGTVQVEKNPDGTAKVDAQLRTTVKGIFAAGDAATGPNTIIDAIAQGRLASIFMDRFLGGKGDIDPPSTPETAAELPEHQRVILPRPRRQKLAPSDRIAGFDLIEAGYDETTAVGEAKRCLCCDLRSYQVALNPDLCKGCGYCMEICGLDVFSTADAFNAGGYKPLVAEKTQNCVGCLKCVYVCPDLAISLKG